MTDRSLQATTYAINIYLTEIKWAQCDVTKTTSMNIFCAVSISEFHGCRQDTLISRYLHYIFLEIQAKVLSPVYYLFKRKLDRRIDRINFEIGEEVCHLQKAQLMDSVHFIDNVEMEEDFTCVVPGDCFSSFGQTPIPSTANANLLLAECDGLPHALKVIGSSLHGKSHEAWERAMKKISKGECISDYQKKGLIRLLQITIDSLDDVAKECFQDLGLFPEDRKICVDALLDIWVYVRNLQWHNAFAILSELASKNLLNLTITSGGRAAISNRNTSELYFSQNNLIRELALHLGCQGSVVHKKRLVMPRKGQSSSQKRELLNGTAFDAQLLSIHTGHMEENCWKEMKFPEVEALLLQFTSAECFLPPFLKSMKNLKCLMVFNYSTKRGTIKGLDVLSALHQVKSVRLERLIVLPTQKESKSLPNIEKLSLSLCEGFEYTSTFNNVNLIYFNLDHSSNLEEVPLSFCYMPSAHMWSITNCHLIQKLPYDLGNLSSLKMLKLSALPGLKELPASIGKLELLECLDISFCEGLRELPEEIGQLKKLNELDMRECSRLTRLPRAVCGLNSLKLVICDEKVCKQWLRAKNISIAELRIEIAEAHFSLDWLDD